MEMKAIAVFIVLALIALGCGQATAETGPATARPTAATSLPQKAAARENKMAPKTSSTSGMRQSAWMQPDGYVPVPEPLKPRDDSAEAPGLPPANNFGFLTEAPPPSDPLGTNVFSDTKYAPANVQAAIDAAQNPELNEPLPANVPVAGMGSFGGMGGGRTGGMQGSLMAPTPSTDIMAPSAPGGNADSVFATSGNTFNNRYTPSVGNAIGSSDTLLNMVIAAPEQQVALSGDALRSMLGRISNTPPERIYVYQTRTTTGANGQPSLSISFLFKNTVDAERSRQQSTFGSSDIMRGFIDNVAKATRLQIVPGSIKVSSAVNDGSMMAAGGAAGAPGGQLPMMMPGGQPMMMPQGQFMPGSGAAGAGPAGKTAAAAPPASATSGAGSARVAPAVLSCVAMLLAALAVL